MLTPPDPEATVRAHLIAYGRLRPGANSGLAGWVLPMELAGDTEPPSAALVRMRDAEREDGQE